jgi:iron(III) transport system substrate-binding protein
MSKCLKLSIFIALMAGILAPALASELALYEGADRQARLVEAAKKEGEVTVYYIYPNLDILAAAFTKKYDIKVKLWRSSSEGILQRVVSEARGNRFDVDIVQNSAQENEALHREKLLQAVKSPYLKDLVPAASPAHKDWVGTKINVFILAYNTNKIKKEDLPKSYQDFLDPRWKGRLGIEANNHHWFATLTNAMGEQQALKLFDNIVSANGISVRKGHSLLTQLVASGEVPLSLTVYDWNIGPLKQKGAPIDGFVLQPTIAQFDTMAVPKRAPNPNAALLFYDFVLSDEGQKLIAATGAIPVSKKFDSPFTRLPLYFVDPGKALDMNDAWKKTWEDVVIKRSK